MFFKTKLSRQDFINTIYTVGLELYEYLKTQFNNEIQYNATTLFTVFETIFSSLTKYNLEKNNIKVDFDIVEEVNKIVYLAFQNENDKWNYCQYFVYIKPEIYDIIYTSKNKFIDLSNYLLDEITNNTQNIDNTLIQYISTRLSILNYNIYTKTKNIIIIN